MEQLCNMQGGLRERVCLTLKKRRSQVWLAPSGTLCNTEYFSCYFSNFYGRKTPFPKSIRIHWMLYSTPHSCRRRRGFDKNLLPINGCSFKNNPTFHGCCCWGQAAAVSSSDWCGLWQREPAIMVQMPHCSFSVAAKQKMSRQEKFSCPKMCSAKTARIKRVGWSLLW